MHSALPCYLAAEVSVSMEMPWNTTPQSLQNGDTIQENKKKVLGRRL